MISFSTAVWSSDLLFLNRCSRRENVLYTGQNTRDGSPTSLLLSGEQSTFFPCAEWQMTAVTCVLWAENVQTGRLFWLNSRFLSSQCCVHGPVRVQHNLLYLYLLFICYSFLHLKLAQSESEVSGTYIYVNRSRKFNNYHYYEWILNTKFRVRWLQPDEGEIIWLFLCSGVSWLNEWMWSFTSPCWSLCELHHRVTLNPPGFISPLQPFSPPSLSFLDINNLFNILTSTLVL